MLKKPTDPCASCVLWGSGKGYVPASGSGDNGVLMVLEAAGEAEENEGMPVVGKAGYYLFQQLQRVGIEREGFRIHNVLSCRPPDNQLAKMPYEDEAIIHCSPLLDKTIEGMKEKCKKNGKQFVILTLGIIAFKRIMNLLSRSPILKEDYWAYPFWSDRYQAWVIAGPHPSYLMRGNHHLVPVLQFITKRALEIAEKGYSYHDPIYIKDPGPSTFAAWVNDYIRFANSNNDTYLAFDIETPHKQGKNEEKVSKEDDSDYTILRCSFSYRPNEAISVPWRAEYLPYLEAIFSSPGDKLAHNANYDVPRIEAQIHINGTVLDTMVAWHILNSALPKSLGFITPFFCQDMPCWKYMSSVDPAGYNCQDADATLRDWGGIKDGLKEQGLWDVFDRHVVQLNKVLSYMSGVGVLRDEEMRSEAERTISNLLDTVESKFESTVPMAARKHHPKNGYVKEPKDIGGLIQIEVKAKVKRCSVCSIINPKKSHFKTVSVKKQKEGRDTACEDGHVEVKEELIRRWAKPLPFKVSMVGMTSYQKALKHQAIISRREKKVTFDEIAIGRLIRQHPKDPLYPLILEHREYQKLLSTYIGVTDSDGHVRGGMATGQDGRIHTLYTQNPETLRLASQHPNLQNLPRPKGEEDLATIIRNLVISNPGEIFTARDYSGIEAVLVGYFALSPRYIRLAKIDVHSFYTAYALNQLDGRVHPADLPLLSWSDERLIPHLAAIKKEFKIDRNNLYKHLVHGANFMQGVKGAQEKVLRETGVEPHFSKVKTVMGIYFDLFPEIKKWHSSVMNQAEKDGYLRNPFGYVLRFNKVYKYQKVGGKWNKTPGDEANQSVAFLPQSTAAGIIKEAMLRLYFDRFEEAGQYLRLQTHDELLSECPEEKVDGVDRIVRGEMEKPIIQLPLPERYGMGQWLNIDTEGKKGERWGTMK